MRTLASALALSALLLACGAALAGDTDREAMREKVRRIGKKMEELRGLEFKYEVKLGIKTRSQLKAFLTDSIEKEMPDEKIRDIQKAYVKLGLLPEGLDLKKTFLDMLTSQVAGFYNPRTKRLFVIDRSTDEGGAPEPKNRMQKMMEMGMKMLGLSMDDIVTAHELTHALQDQHFGLERIEKTAAGNDDRIAAIKCVFEGDAVAAQMEFIYDKAPFARGMQNRMGNLEAMGGAGNPAMQDLPAILRIPLVYPYVGGPKLVQAVREKGGWPAVNRMFTDPPLSTEQVLHLEKYLEERDDPVFIDFENVKTLGPAGWRLLESNSLGELGTRILMDEFLSEQEARDAAAGWDGDRFGAYGRGDEVFIFWYSTWDDDAEAREFARSYIEVLKEKYGYAPDESPNLRPSFDLNINKNGQTARLSVRGRDVVVLEGHPSGSSQEMLDRILRGAKKHRAGETTPLPAPGEGERIRGDGWSMEPIEGWSVERSESFNRVAFHHPSQDARLEIGTLPLSRDKTPEEIGNDFLDALPGKVVDFQLEEKGREFAGERPIYTVLFTGRETHNGPDRRFGMVFFTSGKKAVVLTLVADRGLFKQISKEIDDTVEDTFRLE